MQTSTLMIYSALLTLPLTTSAYACGDPSIIFIVGGIGIFQIALTAVILFSRKRPLLNRVKFCGVYLLSLVPTWVLSDNFIHVWFDTPGRDEFSLVALLIIPIVTILFLRQNLSR